jgi:hypothetical protein
MTNQEFIMNKMLKIAIALIALTSVFSFAQESEDGFKLGFYGSLTGGNAGLAGLFEEAGDGSNIGTVGSVGMLFNLGNGLELGIGIGIGSASYTFESSDGDRTDTYERGFFLWEIIPSVSYEFGKKEFVGYGAGLNIHLASYSMDETAGGETVTTKPKNMDMAFFPNFFIKAEVVKNFVVGLKTGFMISMPGDVEDVDEDYYGNKTTETVKRSFIDTKTEVFVSFYL